MILWLFFIILAGWGLLCSLWLAAGWLVGPKGIHLYLCPPDVPPESCIRGYRWLHSLGLLSGPLLILDGPANEQEQEIIIRHYPFVEFCDLAELSARVELERNRFDGTGYGDPPGRHQRRGVSEL